MLARLRHLERSQVLAITVLAALIFGSYIPVGFMPASGAPFTLELCPAYGVGVHSPAHSHHGHSPGHSSFQECPFGSAPAAGPLTSTVALEPVRQPTYLVDCRPNPGRLDTGRIHCFLARGPPSPA